MYNYGKNIDMLINAANQGNNTGLSGIERQSGNRMPWWDEFIQHENPLLAYRDSISSPNTGFSIGAQNGMPGATYPSEAVYQSALEPYRNLESTYQTAPGQYENLPGQPQINNQGFSIEAGPGTPSGSFPSEAAYQNAIARYQWEQRMRSEAGLGFPRSGEYHGINYNDLNDEERNWY